MDDFARMDNNLAKSQTDIGESSNLAQIAQTYACNFDDAKYDDYVCILATLAQIAIDNSKRKFDVDVATEIKRIKQDMDINENKYPIFWECIKKNFKRKNINKSLHCPMNSLSNLDIYKYRNSTKTIPMFEFFIKHKLNCDKKTCKSVEKLIDNFNLKVYELNVSDDARTENYLLLRSDFDLLINRLSSIHLSKNHIGIMSWLIDRAFLITNRVVANSNNIESNIKKNRALLLKVLYTTNPNSFLECFKKG